ncbi:MAG: Crp/Fnr family transcriptional regulator [Erythrobacter sp.]|uniref:Crp/Fnr family transcriptional regulator n=1 Tax=Erythrobacter sp. TaxID=1042 RepID=UPI003C735361
MRSPLSEESRAAILGLSVTQRSFEPLSYIVREADSPRHCGIVVSGFAYRQKLTRSGTKQILSLLIPGDPIDAQGLFLDVADHSVQMLTRGTVALVPKSEMEELFETRKDVAHALLLTVLAEASMFREWIVNLGRRSGLERIAHLLCEFGARLDAAGWHHTAPYELPMTQEDLGDSVGLSPVHVNRSLKALEEDNYVRRGRGTIRFDSWKAMRDLAGFNDRYLHLDRLRNR